MQDHLVQKTFYYFRFILVNLISVLVLLFITNWACGLYLKKTRGPGRAELPNYKENPDHAKAVFNDYGRLSFEYEPFAGWKCNPYKGKTTTISVQGLRIHEPPLQTSDSMPVIRFFGGSTLWGEGSDDQHSIPALFNTMNPGFRVCNHGQLAYNTRQNLDALITLYEKGEKSDIVVFYDGVNDSAFLCPADVDVPGHRLVPVFRDRIYISKKRLAIKIFHELFLEKIVAVIGRFKKQDSSKLYNCLGPKADNIADFFITNWVIAHDLVEKNGGKFIAVLQPVSFVGSPKLDHLDLDPAFRKNVRHVYQEIREKLKEKNYSWVYDLTDSFDRDEYIYIDFCHVSPNGNEIMARKISGIISSAPSGRLP